MTTDEYKGLEVGDIVRWGYGDLYPVDNLNGVWGIHTKNEWIPINPNLLDGWGFVGEAFIPPNDNGHCWHYCGNDSSFDVRYDPEYLCCFCGKHCVVTQNQSTPDGHGKFYPYKTVVAGWGWTGNDRPCPGNQEGGIL